jgi:hypothetical protein
MHELKLTAFEADTAEWAISPMGDMFENQMEEGELDAMPELPEVRGGVLYMPDNRDVIEDFIYRIENQLVDMTLEEVSSEGGIIPYYTHKTKAENDAIVAESNAKIVKLKAQLRQTKAFARKLNKMFS